MSDPQAQHRLQQLTRTVDDLVEKAVQNERILRRYQHYELQLLAADGLESLLDCLLSQSRQHFQLDVVTLWLLDPEETLRGLLAPDYRALAGLRWLASAADLEAIFPAQRVRLASPVAPGFFPDRPVRSAALLPLVRHGRLIGSLHFGSFTPHRFSADKSTDFIDHLGSIIALCLESAADRERLHRLSLVDALTQVGNRRAFEVALERELARATRAQRPLTVLLADLDHFKQVNDTHGHPAGDRVLRQVAQAMSAMLRRTDHVCRCGGEEFALILPDCERPLADEIAERIRQRVERLAIVSDTGLAVPVTLSIGATSWVGADGGAGSIACDSAPDDVGRQLMAAADRALYQAKSAGRNRVAFAPLLR